MNEWVTCSWLFLYLYSHPFTPIQLVLLTMSATTLYLKLGEKLIHRTLVPLDRKQWPISWPDYKPTEFTIDLKGKPWADPDLSDPQFQPKWNQKDGSVDRQSHEGTYSVINGFPLNPRGRTGICGRGRLGRWGPNHAADPVVTRWKRDAEGSVVNNSLTNLPILEFVSIQRKDSGQWAIPGGMVDPGENISTTLKREFMEEALNGLELSQEQRQAKEKQLESFFKESGTEIYRGIVDDPRNTDNAWMETAVFNFNDSDGQVVGKLNLESGDDAVAVEWKEINGQLNLYANHVSFIQTIAKKLNSHW